MDASRDLALLPPSGIAVHVALLVNGQVVGCTHVVWCMDGLGTETKVADGDTTTLLGIILKVGLEKC